MKIQHVFIICIGFIIHQSVFAEQSLRLISADAGITQILIELGYGKNLVGIDITSTGLGDLPRIGYHRQLSTEGLMSLKPDIVIGSQDMGPDAVLNALKKASVNVIQLQKALTIDELIENINTIATAIGCSSCSQSIITNINKKYHSLEENKNKVTKNYIFVMSMGQRSMRYAGRLTSGDALIKLLGGNNIAAHNGYRNISAEGLLSLNPDVILITGRDASPNSTADFQQQNQLLKDKMIFSVDGKSLISGLSELTLDEVIKLQAAGL